MTNDYTYPGQAHLADSSIGADCRECLHYVPRPFVQIQRHCCAKAKQMAGKWLKPIPPHATACKYFTRRG